MVTRDPTVAGLHAAVSMHDGRIVSDNRSRRLRVEMPHGGPHGGNARDGSHRACVRSHHAGRRQRGRWSARSVDRKRQGDLEGEAVAARPARSSLRPARLRLAEPDLPADGAPRGTRCRRLPCVGHDDLTEVVAVPTEGGSDYDVPVPGAADDDLPTYSKYRCATAAAQYRRHRLHALRLARRRHRQCGYRRREPHHPAQHGQWRRRRDGSSHSTPTRQRRVRDAVGRQARDFSTDGKPNQLYVRRTEGTQATADPIPTAINLGGPVVSTKVPSDVLKAAPGRQDAAADRAVRDCSRCAAAGSALLSSIQRSSEIGIRRASGTAARRSGRSSCSSPCSSACWAASSAPRSGSASCISCPPSRTGSS